MPYIECESQSLGQQELGRKYVFWLRLPNRIRELRESEVMVLRFGSEEECGFQDICRVVCHEGIGDVESLDILYCSSLFPVSVLPFKIMPLLCNRELKGREGTLTSVGTFK